MDNAPKFETPKPSALIAQIISYVCKSNDTILDSFSGSGTTAHAVLALNKEDGGNRKFILVECEDYADTITAERVRRVIRGVPGAKDAALREGLGGSFTYCTLGEEISSLGLLTGDNLPSFEELAQHAVYTATGQTLAHIRKDGVDGYIGEVDGKRLHLLYQADVNFLASQHSALTLSMAKRIHTQAQGKPALVFGTHKLLGQKELTGYGITFVQLPYQLSRMG